MTASIDERNRVLTLVEKGQISAAEAAQLLDSLVSEQNEAVGRVLNRTIRVWMSDVTTRQQKLKMTATLPTGLVSASLRLLSHLSPQLNESTIRQVVSALERGATGRILDLQDLEEGKRVEIFVEH